MTHTHPDRTAFLAAIRHDPDCDMARGAFADWLDEHSDDGETCPACKWPGVEIREGFDAVAAVIEWGELKKHCSACSGTGHVPNGFAERAEFVRLQCELARPEMSELLAGHSCERPYCYPCSLRRRESELLMALWPMGIPIEIPDSAPLYIQHPPDRGFLSRLRIRFDLLQVYYPGIVAHPDVVLREVELTTWPDDEWRLNNVPGAFVDRPPYPPEIVGISTADVLDTLRREFPGHCPNHPVKWILPNSR